MVKKLALHRLIPVSTAGALLMLGCGGKATDSPLESEEGTGADERWGDGDDAPGEPFDDPGTVPFDDPLEGPLDDPWEGPDDAPPDNPTEDPLSDANFSAALESHFAARCVELIECDGADYFDGECTEYFVSNMHRIYDTNSEACRGLILEAFACSDEHWSCEPQDDPCLVLYLDLWDDCVDYE